MTRRSSSRGGGTSLAGQCCNVAVVMDFSKYMHQVLSIDAENRLGQVQPGCVLDHFRETAKQGSRACFSVLIRRPTAVARSVECWAIIPAAAIRCSARTTAGRAYERQYPLRWMCCFMMARACTSGPRRRKSLSEIIRAADVGAKFTPRLKSLVDRYGDVIRQKFPKLERRVSGYNLDDLLPENGFQCRASAGGIGIDPGHDS